MRMKAYLNGKYLLHKDTGTHWTSKQGRFPWLLVVERADSELELSKTVDTVLLT